MTKAHVEGHVDTASIGGEVEGGIPASRPNVQELCQGSLDEVEVVHLKRVEQEGEVRVPSSQARVTSLKSRRDKRAQQLNVINGARKKHVLPRWLTK